MRTGHDYKGGAICSGAEPVELDLLCWALVPAESALLVCHLRRWLSGTLLWSEAGTRFIGSGASWEV